VANKQSQIAAIRDRIIPVSEASPYAKVLLYGRNGSGKTRTAATGPKCLLIDIEEQGTKSIRSYPGVEVLPATSWSDIVYAYWLLRSGEHDYETVVLDTITMMQAVCLRQVLKDAVDRDPLKDPKLPIWKDYRKRGQLMEEFLLFYRNLPMHVVFTAQEKTIEKDDEEDETSTERVPLMSAKPLSVACSCVDFIGRIYKRQVTINKKTKKEEKVWRTLMMTGPHDQYLTKDQSGALPRVLANPTMPLIIDAAKSLQEDE